MPTCSCELCTCLYILYKWVLDKIFFSYIDYNLIASYSIGSTTNSLHVRPSHFKYCYFPAQIKLLITSMQILWSVYYLSNKMDTLPHSLFPISLYDLLLTFFDVLLCLIILTQNVIPLIFQMIFAITYRITQTISSYMTHVYFMDIYFKLYAWIIFISPFFKIMAKNVCSVTSLFIKIIYYHVLLVFILIYYVYPHLYIGLRRRSLVGWMKLTTTNLTILHKSWQTKLNTSSPLSQLINI